MAAPKGNQFWKARTKHGRDKLFASADALREACIEYFEWVQENPLNEEKLFAYQGSVTKDTINKMRPMTVEALCLFLDIDSRTWRNWDSDKDFLPITEWAESVIRQQKFAGAVADLMNANIIARDLGLADKQTLGGDPDSPLKVNYAVDETDKQIIQKYIELKGKDNG